MKRIFLSDDVLVAFVDRVHQRHQQAQSLFEAFATEQMMLFTAPFIIERAYNELAATVSPALAREFLQTIASGHVNMLYPDMTDTRHTYQTLENASNLEMKFSDAMIGVLCARYHITTIATFSYIHPTIQATYAYIPGQ